MTHSGFLGIKEDWATILITDYTTYMVTYTCMFDFFSFLGRGVWTDQINIYTRDGKAPTPAIMKSIKEVVQTKMPLIDVQTTNLESLETS